MQQSSWCSFAFASSGHRLLDEQRAEANCSACSAAGRQHEGHHNLLRRMQQTHRTSCGSLFFEKRFMHCCHFQPHCTQACLVHIRMLLLTHVMWGPIVWVVQSPPPPPQLSIRPPPPPGVGVTHHLAVITLRGGWGGTVVPPPGRGGGLDKGAGGIYRGPSQQCRPCLHGAYVLLSPFCNARFAKKSSIQLFPCIAH